MKKLLLSLFLFGFLISPSVFADDISNFSIEGISIGDSLLDYMTEEEIMSNKINYFSDERQYYVVGSGNLKLLNFDSIEFYLKQNDKKFIIQFLTAFIFSINNINDCKTKKAEIERSIKSTLTSTDGVDYGTIAHSFDLSGKSKVIPTAFWLGSDFVRTECTIWSDEIKNGNPDWSDSLSLTAGRGEVNEWFNNGYK
jgi:hypothetical protein